MKFTPERLEQIKNLVERGSSREEIADLVGCTVGSLAVTCSNHGISLRRPKQERDTDRPRRPTLSRVPLVASSEMRLAQTAAFTLRVDYGDRLYELPLDIDTQSLCELSCMAAVSGVKITDIIARAIRELTQSKEVPDRLLA